MGWGLQLRGLSVHCTPVGGVRVTAPGSDCTLYTSCWGEGYSSGVWLYTVHQLVGWGLQLRGLSVHCTPVGGVRVTAPGSDCTLYTSWWGEGYSSGVWLYTVHQLVGWGLQLRGLSVHCTPVGGVRVTAPGSDCTLYTSWWGEGYSSRVWLYTVHQLVGWGLQHWGLIVHCTPVGRVRVTDPGSNCTLYTSW